MSNEKYFDFDQFMEEKQEQPVIIKIFGQKEELPASLPADLVFKIIRLQRQNVEDVNEEQLVFMATRLFGEERLQRWFDKGLTMTGLEGLLQKVMEIYSGDQGKVESEEGEDAEAEKK